ncbi:MAG: branched-chain amino acid aminotransferase [Anaerovoracaceae bacterium]
MFKITRTENPKQKPSEDNLKFGVDFTDHMFVMDYDLENGWHNGQVLPYAPIVLDPAALVFHYGQELFEGMKAYKNGDDILLFRPDMNAKRSNKSSDRLCIPEIPEQLYVDAVKAVVEVDKDWIPSKAGTSLYIRPFIIATEVCVGVKPSATYKFYVILSPVGSYYPKGLAPTKIYVEDKYVRAVAGGTGEAKCGGNYAASLKAQIEAAKKGYDQILWLDGIERKYVEEIGTSNAFFVIENSAGEIEIITAPLEGTILPGITRDSVLKLLRDGAITNELAAYKNMKVSERKITIDEVFEAIKNGKMKEVFATGTAAVISPVGELCYKDECAKIGNGGIGTLSQKLYDTLTGIQNGKLEDKQNWTTKI